ncbi:MAG TPA: response regulator [Gammaproteobacteria bacterium]
MIKVLLVDDHALVRTGLRLILDAAEGIEVVGEAETGEGALDLIRKQPPDIVLMDINMPGIGGIEALHRMLHLDPTLAVIVCSVQGSDPYPTKLMQMGARGYLTKGCPADELVRAVMTVASGERYISSDVAQMLALTMLPHTGRQQTQIDTLSQREMQVLLMVAEGMGIQEIADKLCVSPKTVGTYRHRLYDKLGVTNDVELSHFALRHGIIPTEVTGQ